MKIIINYDFFNAIRDARETVGPLKIVRNEKDKYLCKAPIFFGTNMLLLRDISASLAVLMFEYSLLIGSDMIINKQEHKDKYAIKARKELNQLVTQLSEYNVRTSYEMLLKASLIRNNYYLDNLSIINEKLIDIPVINYSGMEDETSILQEHKVGSNEYILSLGTSEKKKKLIKSVIEG